MTRRNFGVHTDGGGMDTTHQPSKERGRSSDVENRSQNRGFDSPKSIRITGRTQGFLNMQNQSNNNPPKDPVDRKESDMSIGTQPAEEIMRRHQMIRASE